VRVAPPKQLTGYQRDLVCAPWYRSLDPSKPWWDAGNQGKAYVDAVQKARQIGLSEAAAIRIISMCLGRQLMDDGDCIAVKALSGIIVSKDFAGARLVLAKVAANLREMAAAGDDEARLVKVDATKITFLTRGTEVRALAGQGSTIRGNTGFVVLDEFAFVRNQEEMYGAAMPVANANLGDRFGCPVLMITTPWASGSLAHRLFTDKTVGIRQKSVNIYDAVSDGFPIDIAETFARLAIPELIETEYKCVWGKGGSQFFPLEKLLHCVRDDGREQDTGRRTATGEKIFETMEASGLPRGWERAPKWFGIDVGCGVGRDFTACVLWALIEDEYWILGVRAFNHLDDPTAQVDALAPWIRRHGQAGCDVRVDAGVGGSGLIAGLRTRLAGSRIDVIGCSMDRNAQESYAIKFRRLIDTGALRIYAGGEFESSGSTATGGDVEGYRALCLELSQMKAKLAGSGQLQLETPRDEFRGHCDRAWAAMIGLSAKQGSAISVGTSGGGNLVVPAPRITNFDDVGIG
jgi:hypothetical protein